MIPIRDINPRVRVPLVNYALLLGISAVFVAQLLAGPAVEGLIREHGFVPASWQVAWSSFDLVAVAESLQSAVTSTFLHGGWFHVLGNLLYLRVFGDNIEDKLGHLAFFAFYLAAGVVGALAHGAMAPGSTIPLIGASGSIAGVLGAYVVMFPRAKVVTLFPVFIFLTFIEVPAMLFVGIWGMQQFLNGYLAMSGAPETGIAWFAHIGGFVLGLWVGIVWRVLRWRRRVRGLAR